MPFGKAIRLYESRAAIIRHRIKYVDAWRREKKACKIGRKQIRRRCYAAYVRLPAQIIISNTYSHEIHHIKPTVVLDHYWCLVLVCLPGMFVHVYVCYKAKRKKSWINSSEPPHVLLYHLYSDYWCQLQRTLYPNIRAFTQMHTYTKEGELSLPVLIGIEAKNIYEPDPQ